MHDSATLFGFGAEDGVIDGRYRLGRVLGHGGMGIVRAAHDVVLDRDVALKLVDLTQNSPDAMRLFHREAQALARVRHANVIQIYTLGVQGSIRFLVMEYVEGRDVDVLLGEHAARGERMPLERALDIVRQVASGLDSVHQHSLLHRDVKPSNIVVEAATGRAVLIDFGLARPTERGSRRCSLISGTPWYMAPEQAKDGGATSSRSDLYSLACTAFHMLTGRAVFEHTEPYRAIFAHVESPPPAVSSIVPELSPLDAVFDTALAKAPEARYPTCAAFVDALDAAAASVVAPPPCTARRLSSAPSSAIRVLFLGPRDGLRRHVEGVVMRTLRAPGDDVILEGVESRAQLFAALAREPADIVLLEETVEGESEEIASVVRGAEQCAHTEVLAFLGELARDSSRLDALGVRVLPAPVSLRAVEMVLSRMGLRVAQTRQPIRITA